MDRHLTKTRREVVAMDSHMFAVTVTVSKPSVALNWCKTTMPDRIGYAHAHEHDVGSYMLTVGFTDEDAAAKFKLFWGLSGE